MNNNESGNLFIVSAPSGGGKTSLVRKLVSELENTVISVSHTTRLPRPGEVDGVDYNFISDKQFNLMLDSNEFIEYASVFNYMYGTAKAQILKYLKEGRDILFDIDWQGAQQLKKIFPDAVTIFILPPSIDSLQQRLLARAQDSQNVVAKRMQKALDEISHYAEFDYLILNDDFIKALHDLKNIIIVNRLTTKRQAKKLHQLLSILMVTK